MSKSLEPIQIKMFGQTERAMIAAKPDFYDNQEYALAILSDSQEELTRGNIETARQFINKAKFFLCQYRIECRQAELNRRRESKKFVPHFQQSLGKGR